MLSSKNIALRGAQVRKLAPRYLGPFKIVALKGSNAVKLEMTGRFRLLSDTINIEYLRPYQLRDKRIGEPPRGPDLQPVDIEPAGHTWYEIEDILDHKGAAGKQQRFLVRWKDSDASMDSWIPRAHVALEALVAYEKFLQAHARINDDGTSVQPRKDKYESFIGKNGEFSAIAEFQRQCARDARKTADTQSAATRSAPSAPASADAKQARDARRLHRSQARS